MFNLEIREVTANRGIVKVVKCINPCEGNSFDDSSDDHSLICCETFL